MNGQFQVYKKQGALQVNLITYNVDEKKGGAIYLEAAPCTDWDKKIYDWGSKVKFALGIADIATLLDKFSLAPQQGFSLFHVPGGNSAGSSAKGKKLSFTPGVDKYSGTWLLEFRDDTQQAPLVVKVNLGAGEAQIFEELIRQSISAVVGFNNGTQYRSKRMEGGN